MRADPSSSRIAEVLRPLLLGGVLLATISAAGLALAYDHARASMTIQVVFASLLFPSIFLIFPYLGSIAIHGFGNRGYPLLGVRAAALGCVGLAAMIGLAIAAPVTFVLGAVGLTTGLGMIAGDLLWSERQRRAGRSGQQ